MTSAMSPTAWAASDTVMVTFTHLFGFSAFAPMYRSNMLASGSVQQQQQQSYYANYAPGADSGFSTDSSADPPARAAPAPASDRARQERRACPGPPAGAR